MMKLRNTCEFSRLGTLSFCCFDYSGWPFRSINLVGQFCRWPLLRLMLVGRRLIRQRRSQNSLPCYAPYLLKALLWTPLAVYMCLRYVKKNQWLFLTCKLIRYSLINLLYFPEPWVFCATTIENRLKFTIQFCHPQIGIIVYLPVETLVFDCSCNFQSGGEAEVTGSPTEKAILNWGIKVLFDWVNPYFFLQNLCEVYNFSW